MFWFQESHVRINTFNYSNLHDMTNFIIEIHKVEVHLPEWWVTLHLYAQQYNYKCRETVAHARSGELRILAKKHYEK